MDQMKGNTFLPNQKAHTEEHTKEAAKGKQ